jgi:TolA-binding protein
MKNPVIILIVTFIFFVTWLTSCHNYDRTTAENQAIQNGDSAVRADSIKAVKGDQNARMAYQKDLQVKIDSMNARLIKMDSINARRKNVDQAKWYAARKRINAGIQRLQARQAEISNVKKDKWKEFKNQIDTAVQNIKYEWKNGE